MSEYAANYYQQRAADMDIATVPPLLQGDPVVLYGAEKPRHVADVVQRFVDAVEPVEDFVMAGVPGVYAAQGEPLTPEAWQRMLQLPRFYRYGTLNHVVSRHFISFLVRAEMIGAPELTMEAVTRGDVPHSRLRRAVQNKTEYIRSAYEPAQAYLMMEARGARNRYLGRLLVMQGMYDVDPHTGDEYLTPRYGGLNVTIPFLEKNSK
jgi:hypothetical protein